MTTVDEPPLPFFSIKNELVKTKKILNIIHETEGVHAERVSLDLAPFIVWTEFSYIIKIH